MEGLVMATKKIFLTAAAVFLLSTSALASKVNKDEAVNAPTVVVSSSVSENDPLESTNRSIYKFNDTIDNYLLEPVARGYRFTVPAWGRDRVSSFFNNVNEPGNFINSILQGDMNATFVSFWRFTINSTIGIGGLHDVAGGFGLREKEKDFGQTLAVYGVGSGPYLMLPFFGPSNPRDTIGLVADKLSDPTTYLDGTGSIGLSASGIVDKREGLLDITDQIESDSLDPYSTIRSGWVQKRREEIRRAKAE
jgi:phospholipid-binding lipoprotein MlaA